MSERPCRVTVLSPTLIDESEIRNEYIIKSVRERKMKRYGERERRHSNMIFVLQKHRHQINEKTRTFRFGAFNVLWHENDLASNG